MVSSMNEYDRQNLRFLLTASPTDLIAWYASTSADDHDYAAELMSEYSAELDIKTSVYAIEEIDLSSPSMTVDASKYLSKFRLGSRH
jgi:hypothetical protein